MSGYIMLGFMAILAIVTIIVVTHVPEKLRRLSFWVIQEEGCPVLVLQKFNGEFQNIGSAIDFKHFGLNLNNYLDMTLGEKRIVFLPKESKIKFQVVKGSLEISPYLYLRYGNYYEKRLASLKYFDEYGLNPNDFVNMKPGEVKEVTLNIESL